MRRDEEESYLLIERRGHLEEQLRKTKSRLYENESVTDKSVLIDDLSITLEYFKHMFSCFKIFKDKYGGLNSLGPNILRNENIRLVIDLPACKTESFEEFSFRQLDKDLRFWLKRKFNPWYFETRFEYSFECLNNSTPNQLLTLKVKDNRLSHLSAELRFNRLNIEINKEIEYFLVTIASILSTIQEQMMNDWKDIR